MGTHSLPFILVEILAAIFAATAIIELAGSRFIRARFRQWRHPRQFYRVMGILQLITAFFLAAPQLRIWGIILAGLLTFFWVVTLLGRGQWRWAGAGMLIMIALVPASLAVT